VEAVRIHELGSVSDAAALGDSDDNEGHIVSAVSMVPGSLYRTLGASRFLCRVSRAVDPLAETVRLEFYEPRYHHAWNEAEVQPDYKVKESFDENDRINVHSMISKGTSSVAGTVEKRPIGRISRLKMMECWGLYFRKHMRVAGGRALIVRDMVAEFPDRAEGINKWVDAYRSYFNLGKLPGCIKQHVKLEFIPSGSKDPLAGLED